MTRFSAQLRRLTGDPVWFSTVEIMYQQRLESWLREHDIAYAHDGVYYTVEDSSWTVLALWDPEPALELVLE
jgi:hypothetical protein